MLLMMLAGRLRQVAANDVDNPQMRILAGLEYDDASEVDNHFKTFGKRKKDWIKLIVG